MVVVVLVQRQLSSLSLLPRRCGKVEFAGGSRRHCRRRKSTTTTCRLGVLLRRLRVVLLVPKWWVWWWYWFWPILSPLQQQQHQPPQQSSTVAGITKSFSRRRHQPQQRQQQSWLPVLFKDEIQYSYINSNNNHHNALVDINNNKHHNHNHYHNNERSLAAVVWTETWGSGTLGAWSAVTQSVDAGDSTETPFINSLKLQCRSRCGVPPYKGFYVGATFNMSSLGIPAGPYTVQVDLLQQVNLYSVCYGTGHVYSFVYVDGVQVGIFITSQSGTCGYTALSYKIPH